MRYFRYYFLTFLLCYFAKNIYTAPRIETEQLNLPDANLNTITIEDELITKKLEVTESAIICNDAYLCNLTVGDTFSTSGSSELTNLTVSGNSELTNLTVSGNSELTNLTVNGNSELTNLTVSGNFELTNLTVTGDTLLNDGSVIGNFTIDGTLLVNSPATLNSLTIINDTDIGCNLTVGCNIYTQDSNFSIGNYYKGGTLWLHNFGINNTFLGKNAGNLTITGGQNVGIGNRSLTVLSAGNNNTAVGEVAGKNITTGSSNTALGSGALGDPVSPKNLTGSNNTAIGNLALTILDTTGNGNTAVGQGVMVLATTASNNTALGQGSLPAITTGSSNIAIGVSAGGIVTNGSGNIYINANAAIAAEANTIRIGTSQTRNFQVGIRGVTPTNTNTALVSIDSANQLGTGIIYDDANFADTTTTQGAILKNGIIFLHNPRGNNLFLGRNAGNRTVVGSFNIGIGENSTNSITSGSNNIGIGLNTLTTITNGNDNVAIGSNALDQASGGAAANIAIGRGAFSNLSSGIFNIAIGLNAGTGLTTGDNNIYIGNVGGSESNSIRLGNDSHQSFICEAIQNVSYPAAAPVDVVTDVAGDARIGVNTSSKRFKENIQPISSETASLLLKANPVTFHYIEHQNIESKPLHYGFIAEEIEEILPDFVAYKDGQPFSVVYRFFYALLLKLIQDHDKKINALEKQNALSTETITNLNNVIESLTTRIIALENNH